MKLLDSEKDAIIDDMLDFLAKELEISLPQNLNKRNTLNTLMLLNTNFPIADYFYALQNKLLMCEAKENAVELKNANPDCFPFVKADILLFFSNTLLRGDTADCLDNKMVLSAGVQLNEFYFNALKADGFNINYCEPYIFENENLNCEYIAKILVNEDETNLRCAINKFAKFVKTEKLKSAAIYALNDNIKTFIKQAFNKEKIKAKIIFI